ncbi:Tropinesterase [uncultured Ruminococcus sp.]|nr:Tropinesterase [uncultured Ruminococcus sp.]
MKKSIITPSGDKIAYVEKGTGDPVILIHGFTGNTGAWTETIEKLGNHYHTYAYDLLGHGETVMADNDSVGETALADQLYDFITCLDLHNVTVIAHSLGCCVLYQYVLKYGCKNWKAMIMADMTPAMNTSDDWTLIAAGGFGSRSALQAMEDDYYGYMRSFFYVGLPTEGLSEEDKEKMFLEWYHMLEPQLVKKVLASCQPDYRHALELITVPAAYFYAAHSEILPHPDQIAEEYRKRITKIPIELVPFDCTEHPFPELHNEEFVKKVESFIEKNK